MKKLGSIFISLLLTVLTVIPVFSVKATESNNLALGKNYTVESEANIDNAFPNLALKDPTLALTDGKYGTADNANTNWLTFYRGLSKTVVVDLGKEMYINEISASFLQLNDWGIFCPRTVKFAVSADGEEYSTVYSLRDDTIVCSTERQVVEKSFKADGYYAARYIKVYFTCDVNVYADEIEVYGTEEKPENVISTVPDKEQSYPNKFVSNKKEILDGANNIVLLYTGKYYSGSESSIGTMTESSMLPYAAYVDKSGNYTDTMFDSYLFLPLAPGENCEGSFTKQKGWEIYLEHLIGSDENINLTALNDTVGAIKEKLGLSEEYKVNIFMTVPEIPVSKNVFGTLGGNENVTTENYESCSRIVKWFVDKSEKAFNDAGYEHLSLTGFYWYAESVHYSDTDFDDKLIKYFTDYCHSLNHAAIWIPYYGAPGFWEANDLGFDAAALQTGYAFPREEDSETGNPKKGTCYDSMSIAKKYGMGVEIEIQFTDDIVSRYGDYLNQACALGCMKNGISMYYQGGGEGAFYTAAYSSESDKRTVYDMTYRYIKGTYTVSPPYMDYEGEITLTVDANKKTTRGKLPIMDADTTDGLTVEWIAKPAYGTLFLDGKGTFSYTPNEGFTGEDSFEFKISDGTFTTESYTVKLNVTKSALTYNGTNVLTGDSMAVIYTDSEKLTMSEKGEIFVCVSADGIITEISDKATKIPDGGYILCGTGEKCKWIANNIKTGMQATDDEFTDTVFFYGKGDVQDNSQPTNEGNEPDFIPYIIAAGVVIIIAAGILIILIYFKRKK